ncbi:MAG: hypothetical protein HOP12_07055 [Candidatus Eisenbacteria bacterium]|uniref:VWA domain-containing protein n=1 Tax=Eiseniibacteriota bacterium TaxID=2212470 RepID=A0A849SEV9_UNCEI|nr:hypothetical protein [Candidatus Eisenbacteria bacterium]
MKRLLSTLFLIATVAWAAPGHALVKYDAGTRSIRGVQLLQDATDPKVYYYLPQYPRLATREDGTFELLCLKYLDANGGASGGLFHALIEFTLPPELLAQLQDSLKLIDSGARIAGPVPLMQMVKDGEEGKGSFQVISSLLADRGDGGFTRSMVASGTAPVTPESRAVVGAILSAQGATLLWNSLTGPTSDVSVAIHAYYEAAVPGYNARVTADASTVYQHFSQIANTQKTYSRRQIRDVVDKLKHDGTLKVEVFDRSQGLGIKNDDMAGVLQVVTDKLTQLMFDASTGWSSSPARETAVESNQIQGRQDRGWLARTFGGAKDTQYYTDDQWVLKKRQDIRQNTFVLTLSKNSTIKVPLDTAGNLGGLYGALGQDTRYFRIVNLADPAFEFRPVFFQLDGDVLDSFQDDVNFVSVSFRKTYADRPAFTKSIQFSRAEIQAGKTAQTISFPRLGMTGNDWTGYEYQTRWSLRGGPTLSVPARAEDWIKSHDAAISLAPPLERRVIEIEADRQQFAQQGLSTAVVEFASTLAGKPRLQRKATLRATDTAPTSKVSLYLDPKSPLAYRVSWHSAKGDHLGRLGLVESDYLFIVPPSSDSLRAAAGGGR